MTRRASQQTPVITDSGPYTRSPGAAKKRSAASRCTMSVMDAGSSCSSRSAIGVVI